MVYLMPKFKLTLALLSSLFLFVSIGLNAQDVETKTDSTSVSNESIAIGDISEESEKLGQQVSKLKSALDAKNRILEIDSIVEAAAPKILELVDSAFLNREDVTLRDLKVRKSVTMAQVTGSGIDMSKLQLVAWMDVAPTEGEQTSTGKGEIKYYG